jgi:hypothetical protein
MSGPRYETVRPGCATGWADCPHGPDAVTVYELDRKGRRRYTITSCVHRNRLDGHGQ